MSLSQLLQVAQAVGSSLTRVQLYQILQRNEHHLNRVAHLVGSLSPDQHYQAAQAVSKNLNVYNLNKTAQAVGINTAKFFRLPAFPNQAVKDAKPDGLQLTIIRIFLNN